VEYEENINAEGVAGDIDELEAEDGKEEVFGGFENMLED